jgi:hypothetical protein
MVIKPPLPKRVYKFMEPRYLKELKETKTFFINHLNNYPEEKLGSEIGDNNEGTLITKFEISDYTFNNGKSNNPTFEKAFHSLQNGIKIGENSTNISLKNVSIIQNIDDNNYFVYCSCLEYNQKTKKEFGDAVLIINDFLNFLICINKEMIKKEIQPYSFGACEYVKKRENVFTEFDHNFVTSLPFLIKEGRYSYQKEFRVLWKNKNNEVIKEPIFLHCPEAIKYCSFEF